VAQAVELASTKPWVQTPVQEKKKKKKKKQNQPSGVALCHESVLLVVLWQKKKGCVYVCVVIALEFSQVAVQGLLFEFLKIVLFKWIKRQSV
jgi:hypothetical protein